MSVLAHILHLAVPHRSNNFRARLLQPLGMFTLLVAFLVSQLVVHSFSESRPGVLGYAANISVAEVIRLTNQKRSEGGLQVLQTNNLLNQAAEAKGRHMLEYDYWAHIGPEGTEPWDFFVNVGYKYRYAGENLARDFSNPQAAVDAWMASASHKDNLMSPKYTEIGIAVIEGDLNGVDTTLIVQLFGTPMNTAPIVNTAPAAAEEIAITPVASAETKKEVSVPKLDVNNELVAAQSTPELSPLDVGRFSASIVILLLFALLLIDVFILWHKRMPRNGGRPLAHISFMGLIFVIILAAKAGNII